MKAFPIRRTNGNPTQWNAYGDTEADALTNWKDCFGEGFELVQATGRAVR